MIIKTKRLTNCIFVRYTKYMGVANAVAKCTGFDWDEGNFVKNWDKNGVSASECEQVFFNRPFVTRKDEKHSKQEPRFYVLGHTDVKRPLFVVFTIRKDCIRVISARDMNRSERRVYEEAL